MYRYLDITEKFQEVIIVVNRQKALLVSGNVKQNGLGYVLRHDHLLKTFVELNVEEEKILGKRR